MLTYLLAALLAATPSHGTQAQTDSACRVALASAAHTTAFVLDETPTVGPWLACVARVEDDGTAIAAVLKLSSDSSYYDVMSYWEETSTTDTGAPVLSCVPNRIPMAGNAGYRPCPRVTLHTFLANLK